MLTQHLRRFAPSVSLLLVLVGFTLVMIGNEPIRFAGAALLVLAIFVPFFSLGVKPDPVGWDRDRDAARSNRPDGPAAMEPLEEETVEIEWSNRSDGPAGRGPTAGAAPDAKTEPRATSDPALRTRLDHEV